MSDREFLALCDSGNSYASVISKDVCESIGIPISSLLPVPQPRVHLADAKSTMEVLGRTPHRLHLRLGPSDTKLAFRPVVVSELASAINLGGAFLRQHNIIQDHGQKCLWFQGRRLELEPSRAASHLQALAAGVPLSGELTVAQEVVVPPMKEAVVHLRYQHPGNTSPLLFEGAPLMVKGAPALKHLEFPKKAVLRARDPAVTVLNTSNQTLVLPAGQLVGRAQTVAAAAASGSARPRLCEMTPSEAPPTDLPAKTKADRLARVIEVFELKDNPLLKDKKDFVRACALLLKYYNVFSFDGELGKTSLVQHDIRLLSDKPINQKVRPLNPIMAERLQAQIDKWLAQEVIEPSDSPYNHPLVPVSKKDGSLRWCIDYRQLNEITERDNYPVGDAATNLHQLGGSSVFSSIDAVSAFHAIKLTDRASRATAFSTPRGHYAFVRMPFGLKNAPSAYARLVNLILKGIPPSTALPYLDDCVCHSPTLDAHFPALESVLKAFMASGIKLEPKKCHLFRSRITYLGHEVTKVGTSPTAGYVKIVQDWPVPRNRTALRSFLGKCTYYKRYIKNFAALARPLFDKLVQDGTGDKEPFEPSPAFVASFHELKQALVTAPILAHPRWDLPFILDTDWSGTNRAIGAVLSQVIDGKEHPVAFAGKRLSPTEANYDPHKGELFAVMFFLRYFKYFLFGKQFILRTDHKSLTSLRTQSDPPSAAVMRWLESIANFDFKIVYREGPKHGNADSLSRAEHLPNLKNDPSYGDFVLAELGPPAAQSLRDAQLDDPAIAPMFLSSPPPPNTLPPYARLLRALKDSCSFRRGDGVLMFHTTEGAKVPVLPRSWQDRTIWHAHQQVGHRAAASTVAFLQERCFFLGMHQAVKDTLLDCRQCQTKTRAGPPQRHTHRPKLAGYPWQSISVDFVGPLPESPGGYKYLLTIRDWFSKWPEAIPTRDMKTSTVLRVLTHEVFARHGFPEQIHSDNQTSFRSQELVDHCATLGVKWTFTPPYSPKSNMVERFHRDLNSALTSLCDGSPRKWREHLPTALFAARSAVSVSTGTSPFFLLYGRRPRCPLDLLLSPPDPLEEGPPRDSFRDRETSFLKAFRHAREHLHLAVERGAALHHGRGPSFPEGSKVWVFNPVKHGSRKFSTWWTGPWVVVKRVNDVVYTVRPEDRPQESPQAVGIDRLREFRGDHQVAPPPGFRLPPLDLGDETIPPPEPDSGEEGAEEAEVFRAMAPRPAPLREDQRPPIPLDYVSPRLPSGSTGPTPDLGGAPTEWEDPESGESDSGSDSYETVDEDLGVDSDVEGGGLMGAEQPGDREDSECSDAAGSDRGEEVDGGLMEEGPQEPLRGRPEREGESVPNPYARVYRTTGADRAARAAARK